MFGGEFFFGFVRVFLAELLLELLLVERDLLAVLAGVHLVDSL